MLHRMLSEANNASPETSELIKDLAAIVYLGGSDTTVAAVISFFLAMVIYPDVQLRAQAELDSVAGRGRLPEFSDKQDMPYVNAVMSECLRWIPVVPMGSSIYIVLRTKKCRD
jgi:cytochrome P450